MDLMNRVCKPYLDKFMIVFIDDILIYSKNKEECKEHLKLIIELIKKDELRGPEFTWEREDQYWKKYPHLFTKTAPSSSVAS
nr:putative reverse transcriptase domain-containing protein [Tanacetum cinerariifolium]